MLLDMAHPPSIPIAYFPNIPIKVIFPSPLPYGCFACLLTKILHTHFVYSLKLHTQAIIISQFHYPINSMGTSTNERKCLVM